jgi:hypothetical protein
VALIQSTSRYWSGKIKPIEACTNISSVSGATNRRALAMFVGIVLCAIGAAWRVIVLKAEMAAVLTSTRSAADNPAPSLYFSPPTPAGSRRDRPARPATRRGASGKIHAVGDRSSNGES